MASPRKPTDLIRDKSLLKIYRAAVQQRGGSNRVPGPTDALLQGISDRLGDFRLSELFIEAQFESLPVEWCQSRFGRPYPPASMVFGAGSWERYQGYLDRGNRIPVRASR